MLRKVHTDWFCFLHCCLCWVGVKRKQQQLSGTEILFVSQISFAIILSDSCHTGQVIFPVTTKWYTTWPWRKWGWGGVGRDQISSSQEGGIWWSLCAHYPRLSCLPAALCCLLPASLLLPLHTACLSSALPACLHAACLPALAPLLLPFTYLFSPLIPAMLCTLLPAPLSCCPCLPAAALHHSLHFSLPCLHLCIHMLVCFHVPQRELQVRWHTLSL